MGHTIDRWLAMIGATARAAWMPASAISDVAETVRLQLIFTFVHAIPIATFLSLLGAVFGIVLQVSAGVALSDLSPDSPLGRLALSLTVREAVPLTAAIVIVARSGTAVAAELAAAVVDSEVEAIEDLGVDPILFWVVPRVVGLAISTALLVLFILLAAGFGYWAMAAGLGRDVAGFEVFARSLVTYVDLGVLVLKGLVAGAGIGLIASEFSFMSTRSVSDLPRSVASSTIAGVVWALTSSVLISILAIRW